MSDIPEAERQVLITAYELGRRERPATEERLARMGTAFFEKKLEDWKGAAQALVDRGLLKQESEVFTLTAAGWKLAESLDKEMFSGEFAQILVRSVKSATYSKFCEIVYGRDLCQYNLSDMAQLDKMLELLALQPRAEVLDLGCGQGLISEYISDLTGAKVTGLDYAAAAIELAREHSAGKRERLEYQVGDIDHLKFAPESFAAIIAIDTLYFLRDLGQTIADLRDILKPGGQLGIFYTQTLRPDQPQKLLEADNTELAAALRQAGFAYVTYDYSVAERQFWELEQRVSLELRSEFEAEGNLDLCESRIEEAERMLKLCKANRNARYLYHAKME